MIYVLLFLATAVGGQQQCSVVGRTRYDSCERRCICEQAGGGLVENCYRERKEISCMTTAERARYINTYRRIATPGHRLYIQWRTLIGPHASFFDQIHGDNYFLPWHRWFSNATESLLQQEDCRITLPWWDTAKNAGSPWNSPPWGAAADLFGTVQVSNTRRDCVRDGGFGFPLWRGGPQGCLWRSRTSFSSLPTYDDQARTLTIPAANFIRFTSDLETRIHDPVHARIGGTMVQGYSPEAPEFFLHHNNIDRLWDTWQQRSAQHLTAHLDTYPALRNREMPVAQGTRPGQVESLRSMRVIYVRDSPNAPNPMCTRVNFAGGSVELNAIAEAFVAATPDDLLRIPRAPVAGLTPEEEEMLLDMERRLGTNESVAEKEAEFKAFREDVERRNAQLETAHIARTFAVAPVKKELGFDIVQAVSVFNLPVNSSPFAPNAKAKGKNAKANAKGTGKN